jgi:hypothetical protein
MTREPLDTEVLAYLLDARRLNRYHERLQDQRRRTIRLETLWTALAAVYDDLPSGPERRQWLLAVLEELAGRGDIVLPVRHGKRWDRTSEIALPTSVSIAPQSGDGPGISWRQFPLASPSSMGLPASQLVAGSVRLPATSQPGLGGRQVRAAGVLQIPFPAVDGRREAAHGPCQRLAVRPRLLDARDAGLPARGVAVGDGVPV